MTATPLEPEMQHDLYVHVQYHHAAMPPYDGTIEEVHGWLHEDREDERDWNHEEADIILPPHHEYPVSGRKRRRSPR